MKYGLNLAFTVLTLVSFSSLTHAQPVMENGKEHTLATETQPMPKKDSDTSSNMDSKDEHGTQEAQHYESLVPHEHALSIHDHNAFEMP